MSVWKWIRHVSKNVGPFVIDNSFRWLENRGEIFSTEVELSKWNSRTKRYEKKNNEGMDGLLKIDEDGTKDEEWSRRGREKDTLWNLWRNFK